MTIEFKTGHFKTREQVIAEIEGNGLFVAEADLAPEELTGTPHVHPYRVDIYLFGGILNLHEPGTGHTHRLEPGSKAVVPPDTLHAESSPGPFQAVFGVSVDPATIRTSAGVRSTPAS